MMHLLETCKIDKTLKIHISIYYTYKISCVIIMYFRYFIINLYQINISYTINKHITVICCDFYRIYIFKIYIPIYCNNKYILFVIYDVLMRCWSGSGSPLLASRYTYYWLIPSSCWIFWKRKMCKKMCNVVNSAVAPATSK